jgi:hypothetical protein
MHKYHPTKLVKQYDRLTRIRFGLCDKLGSLGLCPCLKRNRETSEMAHQIGVGASLFLMSTKAFSQFFLLLTLVYLPVMFLFYQGNPNPAVPVDSWLAKLSLGNIGGSTLACDQVDFSKVKDASNKRDSSLLTKSPIIELICPTGQTLGLYTTFGMA